MKPDDQIVSAMLKPLSDALTNEGADETRTKLEDLWETQGHPKADLLWELSSEFAKSGYERVEDLYSRLVMLVK